jgi:hypothetical protein
MKRKRSLHDMLSSFFGVGSKNDTAEQPVNTDHEMSVEAQDEKPQVATALPREEFKAPPARKYGSAVLKRRRMKLRDDAFRSRLRQLSSYESATHGGYRGTKTEYDGLVDYMVQVRMATQPRPPSASSSHLSVDSDVESVKSYRSFQIRPPPAHEPFRAEQAWIRDLRKMVDGALNYRPVISDIPTPAFDELKQPGKDVVKQSSFQDFTDEQKSVIKQAFAQTDGVMSQLNGVEVGPKDAKTLRDGQWLNDEIINFYGELITLRSESSGGRLPRIRFLNSFFYSKLCQSGYDGVKRWGKKFKLTELDYLIFPVHLRVHWCCGVINFKQRRIEYYDSLHGSNPTFFSSVRQYLSSEWSSRYSSEPPLDLKQWTNYSPTTIPAQENGYDCGVFTCMFAEYRSREAEFDFGQEHMKYLRRRMLYELITKKLTHQQ